MILIYHLMTATESYCFYLFFLFKKSSRVLDTRITESCSSIAPQNDYLDIMEAKGKICEKGTKLHIYELQSPSFTYSPNRIIPTSPNNYCYSPNNNSPMYKGCFSLQKEGSSGPIEHSWGLCSSLFQPLRVDAPEELLLFISIYFSTAIHNPLLWATKVSINLCLNHFPLLFCFVNKGKQ